LRSTWDIGTELESGALKVLLPQYAGADSVAIHAVYPCRDFMPEKVNVFIEFLSEIYGNEPYWNQRLDLGKLSKQVCASPTAVKAGIPAAAKEPVASPRRKSAAAARQPDGRA
jgi:hypothetical protein